MAIFGISRSRLWFLYAQSAVKTLYVKYVPEIKPNILCFKLCCQVVSQSVTPVTDWVTYFSFFPPPFPLFALNYFSCFPIFFLVFSIVPSTRREVGGIFENIYNISLVILFVIKFWLSDKTSYIKVHFNDKQKILKCRDISLHAVSSCFHEPRIADPDLEKKKTGFRSNPWSGYDPNKTASGSK